MSETIYLHNINGFAFKTGDDQHGCHWSQFIVDHLAEQEDGECSICGAKLTSGWVCGDGGEEVCDEHVVSEEPGEFIRKWEEEDFRLELFDPNRRGFGGKHILAYRFFHEGKLIFEGDDYGCSPCHAIDSDAAVAGLLAFLSCKPGDTDPEYFDSYSPEQMEWCQANGERLGMHVEALEN